MKRLALALALLVALPTLAQTGSPQPVGPTNPFATSGPFAPASALFWFNVKDYGAVGNNSVDCAAAINAAIAAANAAHGGTVYLPFGSYRILSPINLNSAVGVRLVGQQATNSGSGSAANIFYDNGNTDARAVDARTSSGVEIANLVIYANTSFAGTLIDYSGTIGTGTAFGYVHDCIIGAVAAQLPTSLILFDYVAQMKLTHNNFLGGVYAIKGPTVGHNADSVLVNDNQFTRQASASIIDPGGQKWTITGNDFEPLTGANGPMVCIISSHAMSSLSVTYNWFGDGGTDNIAIFQLTGGTNVVIDDNFVGAAFAANSGAGKSHYFLTTFTAPVNGLTVTKNYISGNIEKFIDFGGLASTGVQVKNNRLQTDVATPFANAGSLVKGWLLENTYVTGARVSGEKMSDLFVRASSNAAQTLTDSVETPLTFNTEQWDDDAMHSTVSATDTFTIPTGGAGTWDIHCSCWFAAVNTTGHRDLAIYKSNAPATRYSIIWDKSPSATLQSAVETHAQIRFVEGDQFQCRATQTSGGNLATNATDGRAMVWISATRVGY
jgi:hypothetical protein